MKKIIIASSNKNKIKEIVNIASCLNLNFKFLNLNNIEKLYVEETGNSFEENAIIKAKAYWQKYKIPVISDDSGLCVDKLNGFPGLYSSRYSGGGDSLNIKKLLLELQGVPEDARKASFFCSVCFCNGDFHVFNGFVKGTISQIPSGKNGFGYDPVFLFNKYKKTFAELSLQTKNKISHRASAIEKCLKFIKEKIV
ncbi:MAG: RdgB/HAM1 family non-canonical purine NTP pyrophosphatase [Candidatus Muiribacteriota bacterium]